MALRKDTLNWMALAEYDLETARHMLKSGRYLYVVFMCHLALEKMLKAHVAEVTQSPPAKTHDLIYLVRKAELVLPPALLDFLGKINNASIPTRYPEDLERALSEYSRPVAESYLRQSEEVMRWLKEQLLSKK